MPLRALLCPYCGAPLPAEAKRRVVTCRYCEAAVTWDQVVVRAADFARALERLDERDATERVWLAGLPYRVRGRCGRGESSDVYLAERARRVSELVLLKVLRAPEDADLLVREWETLRALQQAGARGTPHFSQFLPQPVARGTVQWSGEAREVLALRYASGYAHTLDDVVSAHPGGVDARHGVWLWRRMLEMLAWLHDAGWAHGAILPQHVIVNARDHGVRLVGWSCAVELGADRAVAFSALHEAFYPKAILAGAAPTRMMDLVMGARCVSHALGAAPGAKLPAAVPQGIAELLNVYATDGSRAPTANAWELHDIVGRAAREAFGPPTFQPFVMPGDPGVARQPGGP